MRSGSPATDQNIGANGGPLDGQLGRNDTRLAEVERGVNFDDGDVEELPLGAISHVAVHPVELLYRPPLLVGLKGPLKAAA